MMVHFILISLQLHESGNIRIPPTSSFPKSQRKDLCPSDLTKPTFLEKSGRIRGIKKENGIMV